MLSPFFPGEKKSYTKIRHKPDRLKLCLHEEHLDGQEISRQPYEEASCPAHCLQFRSVLLFWFHHWGTAPMISSAP